MIYRKLRKKGVHRSRHCKGPTAKPTPTKASDTQAQVMKAMRAREKGSGGKIAVSSARANNIQYCPAGLHGISSAAQG